MAVTPSTSQNTNIPEYNEYNERYRNYKAIVATEFSAGRLPSELAVREETWKFLEQKNMNPINTVDQYLKKKNHPQLLFYGYELNVTHRFKFFCITEYDGQAFFGVKSPTKKEAKAACILRLMDFLVGQDLVQVLSSKPKSQRKRTFFGNAPVPLNKFPRFPHPDLYQ